MDDGMMENIQCLILDLKKILAVAEKFQRDAPYQAPEMIGLTARGISRELMDLSDRIDTCVWE